MHSTGRGGSPWSPRRSTRGSRGPRGRCGRWRTGSWRLGHEVRILTAGAGPGDVPLGGRQPVLAAAAQPQGPRGAARVRARTSCTRSRPRAVGTQALEQARRLDIPTRGHRDVRAGGVRAAAMAGAGRRPRRPADRHRHLAARPARGRRARRLSSGRPAWTPTSSTPVAATTRCAPPGPTATSRRSSSATSAASARGTAYAAWPRSRAWPAPAGRRRRRPPAGVAAQPPAGVRAVHRRAQAAARRVGHRLARRARRSRAPAPPAPTPCARPPRAASRWWRPGPAARSTWSSTSGPECSTTLTQPGALADAVAAVVADRQRHLLGDHARERIARRHVARRRGRARARALRPLLGGAGRPGRLTARAV